MVIILGTITARPDTVEQLLAASLLHVHRSRAEPGCLSHDVAVDGENPLRLMFTERWADRAAVRAHFGVPESRAFVATAGDLAAQPPTIAVYDVTD